jgi:hypothetical protein
MRQYWMGTDTRHSMDTFWPTLTTASRGNTSTFTASTAPGTTTKTSEMVDTIDFSKYTDYFSCLFSRHPCNATL